MVGLSEPTSVAEQEDESSAPPVRSKEEVDKLVNDNIRLAYKFAAMNSYKGAAIGLSKEDVESIAMHGLFKAARTWKPETGQLSTWAFVCAGSLLNREFQARKCLKRGGGMIRTHNIARDEDGKAIDIEDKSVVDFDLFETRDQAAAALDALDDRQKAVIVGRFFEGKTMEEIGSELGLSRARIGQIEIAAIRKCRQHLVRLSSESMAEKQMERAQRAVVEPPVVEASTPEPLQEQPVVPPVSPITRQELAPQPTDRFVPKRRLMCEERPGETFTPLEAEALCGSPISNIMTAISRRNCGKSDGVVFGFTWDWAEPRTYGGRVVKSEAEQRQSASDTESTSRGGGGQRVYWSDDLPGKEFTRTQIAEITGRAMSTVIIGLSGGCGRVGAFFWESEGCRDVELMKENFLQRRAEQMEKSKPGKSAIGRPRDLERDAEVVRRHEAGESPSTIAAGVGIHRNSVRNTLNTVRMSCDSDPVAPEGGLNLAQLRERAQKVRDAAIDAANREYEKSMDAIKVVEKLARESHP